MYKYKWAIFIGRFYLFHKGHREIIARALKECERVVVLAGSANAALSPRRPLEYGIRAQMIRNEFPDEDRVIIRPLDDILYNDTLWLAQVQEVVSSIVGNTPNKEIALIGYKKDSSSYYIDMFPQWTNSIMVDAVLTNEGKTLDASMLRNSMYCDEPFVFLANAKNYMHPANVAMLALMDFTNIIAEHEFNESYKAQFAVKLPERPYPTIHQTVDSVVIRSGHILLIERKFLPGRGLLALPGGHLNEHERKVDAAVRELREETRLKVPSAVLYGSIRGSETFDDPHRSERGRVISEAFKFHLRNGPLDEVKGRDDAKRAFWMPLNDVPPTKMFEDHFHIIQCMTGRRMKYEEYI